MIALGFVGAAALGTLIRWQAGRTLPPLLGTLTVNIAGSFLLGLLHGADTAELTIVGVAGLGALTTFSTFAQELVDLWPERPVRAAVYGTTALIGGIGAAWLGILAG